MSILVQNNNSSLFVTHSKFRKAVREAAKANSYVPVEVVDDQDLSEPEVHGEQGGYYTKGGSPIYHPNAYAKRGWSNMEYRCSTIAALTPKDWAQEFCEKNFIPIIFGDRKLFIHSSRKLRSVEKELSKVEDYYLSAPEEKKDLIFSAALSIISNSVAFAEIPCKGIMNKKQALTILGYNPKQIAARYGFELSRKEAKEWFYSCCINLNEYLIKKHVPKYWYALRSSEPAVIQWFISVMNDPARKNALIKVRNVAGPHGEKLEYALINKIDEVKSVDLFNGVSSSVNKVFERAAERSTKEKLEWMKNNSKPLIKIPDWYPGDTENWKILRSAADLYQEGEELNHCVATYAGYVKRNQSVIISIKADNGDRSTAEIDPKHFLISEHFGHTNSFPTEACRTVAGQLIRKINENRK